MAFQHGVPSMRTHVQADEPLTYTQQAPLPCKMGNKHEQGPVSPDPLGRAAQVGDGLCSNDLLLNSAACAYDGGDCCPGTCVQQCIQAVADGTGGTYRALGQSCLNFDCKVRGRMWS